MSFFQNVVIWSVIIQNIVSPFLYQLSHHSKTVSTFFRSSRALEERWGCGDRWRHRLRHLLRQRSGSPGRSTSSPPTTATSGSPSKWLEGVCRVRCSVKIKGFRCSVKIKGQWNKTNFDVLWKLCFRCSSKEKKCRYSVKIKGFRYSVKIKGQWNKKFSVFFENKRLWCSRRRKCFDVLWKDNVLVLSATKFFFDVQWL